MTGNTRFAASVHMLAYLAYRQGAAVPSAEIAASVDTNPVVIRRILAGLRAARMVRSQGGPGGGWQLLRDPGQITLRDVLHAMGEASLFQLHSATPNPACPVGKEIQSLLALRFRSAQEAMEKDLERTTIAQLVEEVKAVPA